jgi:hypothetical protein
VWDFYNNTMLQTVVLKLFKMNINVKCCQLKLEFNSSPRLPVRTSNFHQHRMTTRLVRQLYKQAKYVRHHDAIVAATPDRALYTVSLGRHHQIRALILQESPRMTSLSSYDIWPQGLKNYRSLSTTSPTPTTTGHLRTHIEDAPLLYGIRMFCLW